MLSNTGRLVFLSLLATSLAASVAQRDKKAFALFNVVQFKNDLCQSSSSLTGGARNGTCYTTTECTAKSGLASGNCAAGFGVCCVFLQTGTSPTFSENRTYLRNPSFPSVYADTAAVTYTINKCSSDICQYRLDFESFTTLGPPSAVEAAPNACVDTFVVVLSSGFATPTICGKNTGQHIYLNVGNDASSNAKVTMTFTGASTVRAWEIKVSQIPCTATYRAPAGCLQYFDTISGKFTTFNYLETTTKAHLSNQQYSVCIRQNVGFCCNQYYPCPADTDSFTLDGLAVNVAAYDQSCVGKDYVLIPSSSNICSSVASTYHYRYCGIALGGVGFLFNVPVCDCTGPFEVGFFTDAAAEAANPGGRGVCLEFVQLPC